jgi:hypothetical protein
VKHPHREVPGLDRETEDLIAQLQDVHRAVFDDSSSCSDDDQEFDTEYRRIKELFQSSDIHRVTSEDMDALWLRRTEDAKAQGREAAARTGLCSSCVCNARNA